jgi:hypothetical protein
MSVTKLKDWTGPEKKDSRLQLARREPEILQQSWSETICVRPDLGLTKLLRIVVLCARQTSLHLI